MADSQPSQGHEDLQGKAPIGLRWRASYWFTTVVVGFDVLTDIIIYSIITPVLPFRLEGLGYTGVSALVGWLLFAYSAGLVISTIPIAMFSERYNIRRMPLLIGLVILIGSQIMFMEAPTYWLMCLARILQGFSSSLVWIVGLALLCDAAPEQFIGRQLGIALSGMSLGMLVGPPAGGAMYARFGFRAPFVFGVIIAAVDLIGRLLIIERKDAIKWGYDPRMIAGDTQNDVENTTNPRTDEPAEQVIPPENSNDTNVNDEQKSENPIPHSRPASPVQVKPLSLLAVMNKLFKSSRALAALFITFSWGLVYSSQEPTLPLHLQAIWGLNSSKVGLVFLAAVVPTLFSSPLTGWFADSQGTSWITVVALLLAIPWWVTVIVQKALALFIVAYAFESFFTSGVISPLIAELAAVSRSIEGIGYAHTYGSFNLVYGIGTTVGPVVGGQIYDHVKNGWMVLCLIGAALLAVCSMIAFLYMGEDPIRKKFVRRLKLSSEETIRHMEPGL